MFIQLKSGYGTDEGPSWITRLRFTKSWRTAYFRGRTLRRVTGTAFANSYDTESGEAYWVSGPKSDRTDTRYGHGKPIVEDDVRAEYEAFLRGAALPGRERG
jgi:hypothetical protein